MVISLTLNVFSGKSLPCKTLFIPDKSGPSSLIEKGFQYNFIDNVAVDGGCIASDTEATKLKQVYICYNLYWFF